MRLLFYNLLTLTLLRSSTAGAFTNKLNFISCQNKAFTKVALKMGWADQAYPVLYL